MRDDLAMDNHTEDYVNVSHKVVNTPTRRLGMSRKRKSDGFLRKETVVTEHDKVVKECTSPKDKKPCHFSAGTSKEKLVSAVGNKEYLNKNLMELENERGKMEKIIVEKENTIKSLKESSVIMEKIRTLQNLNCTWSNGCKKALLYLTDILEKRQLEPVNVKKLLIDLGIYGVILANFQNDSDLDFFLNDSEDSEN